MFSTIKNLRRRFLLLSGITATSLWLTAGAFAQTPEPSPTPVIIAGFEVSSSVEAGARGLSVNGNDNKFRSDYNFRQGFRVFDSSFRLENKEKKDRFIDSLTITSTGWGGDPSGFTRINVEKTGLYNFTSNVRQFNYFNNLDNNSRNGLTTNTRSRFGDFDLTLYPNSDKLRIRAGVSFARATGDGTFTTRAFSDEFITPSDVDNRAVDYRLGVDTKLLGFRIATTFGVRRFSDRTSYLMTGPNPGFNTTNTARLVTFDRTVPTSGGTQFGSFSVQRTFAKKFDLTARLIYSSTTRDFNFLETITGRDGSNNQIDLDRFAISGLTKRPQTRGDIGLTWLLTDKLRISNTFLFDQFSISGGSAFAEAVFSRTAAGATRPTTFSNILFDRVLGWRRFADTIEADYQFSTKFSANIGYRWTRREINILGFNQTLPPATTPTRTLINQEADNTTSTIIAGMKITPVKHWVIFGDAQRGDGDNAFTRLANYKFTNVRLRSRWNYKAFGFNVAGIVRDNENPSTSTAPPGNYPAGNFVANTKSRLFSAFVDVAPDPRFFITGGYTYNRQITETDIVVNPGTGLVRGSSRFYMRDHYAFFNLSAQPFKRVSLFAGYNYNEDTGQGNLTAALPILLTSYPFRLSLAETRVAIRLARNVDWNIGYQYIGYNERVQPLSITGFGQDYNANLPYTSLRIYFGGGNR